jgi:hypothetical protein
MTNDMSPCRIESMPIHVSGRSHIEGFEANSAVLAFPIARHVAFVLLLAACLASSAQRGARTSADVLFPGRSAAKASLSAAHAVAAQPTGASLGSDAEPLSLGSGDFDEDGVPDLISGYATSGEGRITIQRGNVNALWPYGQALRSGHPPEFLPDVRVFAVPEAPDFIATGDFDADGHWDVVTTRRAGDALYFLRGDGHGGLRAAQRIPLPGTVTAMASGDINRPDGLADLIVAVNTASGAQLLVFESPNGAVRAVAESFRLPASATALAIGRFDGGAMRDIAVATGKTIVVIHGRDRKLSLSQAQRANVASARVTTQRFSYAIEALTAGDFTDAGPSVAALGNDGQIHILEHAIPQDALEKMWLGKSTLNSSIQLGKDRDGKPLTLSRALTPRQLLRIQAVQQTAKEALAKSSEWLERNTIALPSGFNQAVPSLVTAHVTASAQEDVIAADSGNAKVHVFSTVVAASALNASALQSVRTAPGAPSMSLAASLNVDSAPVAVLPMRLNQHPWHSLVTLHSGRTEAQAMDAAPDNVFTVTNTQDGTPPLNIPAGSLRAAITAANAAIGTSSIVFDIPPSDPGCNSSTGICVIKPVPEDPSAGDVFSLPAMQATLTLDGYTQPGASPNTSTNTDNATLLIQIDGGSAVGFTSLVPFDSVGTTIRGLVLTNWTYSNPNVIPESLSGGVGMEVRGISGFVEGNFVGTDPTGKTSQPNFGGIFADGGSFSISDPGNLIGGTTPQSRNLISGNSMVGIAAPPSAIDMQIAGNFIGPDATGARAVPVAFVSSGSPIGVVFTGGTVTLGGTTAGAGNIISGADQNGINVQVNDTENTGLAVGDLIQGNLIGTDSTGETALANAGLGGVVILDNPSDILVGGTTPAARNIISGNSIYGVAIINGSANNLVQGNYIGTDITGAKPLGNGTGVYIGTEEEKGVSNSSLVPSTGNTVGGAVNGAGNVISGNTNDAIQIMGTTQVTVNNQQIYQGNVVQGNLIGTDATGASSIPNLGDGVSLISGATNNVIGGTNAGEGNLIENNSGNGVTVDPGAPPDPGTSQSNNTVGNTIQSNGSYGVLINSGTNNLVSRNSIFANANLGIALGSGGPNINTPCNSTNTGPNDSQNAPVLTAGTGAQFITATATDPNGNTSQFSNAVAESLNGDLLSLLGNFNSKANTTYTIEFFSSPSADPSGFGQGQTYLGSTTVTSNATCTNSISDPVNLTQSDMSVTLTFNKSAIQVGPDLGLTSFTGIVTNNGPAGAQNVVFTDPLPAGLQVSGLYCNTAVCQSPITTSSGTCTVSVNTVTCNLGSMAPGATASINIPVEATSTGSLVNTVTVIATQADPNPANNTASVTLNSTNPLPTFDHFDPPVALVTSGGPSLPLTIYGLGFLPTTTVSFAGTTLPATLFDNQACGSQFDYYYCRGLQVQVPASLLATAGNPTVTVTNAGPGGGTSSESSMFSIASACTYNTAGVVLDEFGINQPNDFPSDLSNLNPGVEGYVYPNVSTCSWTASSTVPWVTLVQGPLTGPVTGSGLVAFAVAPNTGSASRAGSITIAGQTYNFTQDPGSVCSYALATSSATIPAAGGSGSFNATITDNSGDGACIPTVDSQAPWITIPEASGVLTASGPVSYSVAPNLGPPQTGTIMIDGSVFTINRAAQDCYFTLSQNSISLPTAASTGSFAVTASDPSCSWTATSSNASVLSVTSGASGTGNGTVNYSVPANSAGPQTAIITVGNSTANATFTMNQASSDFCSYTLSPATANVPSDGTSAGFTIATSYYSCQWTATSSDPSVLALHGAASGTGSGGVVYSVAANTGGPRTLTIIAGCQTFTVNQDGVEVSNPIPAIATLQPSGTTAGSAAFTLTVNGSGFINGSVVNFNGNARATTFVSASQLTGSILATDVANVGTPSVTVTNPSSGGGTSNAVIFNVTASLITPTVTVTPSPSSITTTQALSVTVAVSGGGSNPTPTGSVTLTSGSYSSDAVALSGGSATVSIPAGTLAKGTDTLTASYAPDSSSSSTYNSATGSNTVAVTSPALITPAVTVTPSPSSITTTQALSVTVTVAGGSGNPTPTGSVTLTSGAYSSGAVTMSGGTATISIPAGTLAAGTDTLTASYTPDSNSSTTYNSATGSSTVTVTAATVQVTVGTSPAGLSFSVDGTSYSSSQTLTWTVGTSHTITAMTPQTLAGTQESFAAWSDNGALSHTVTAPASATTYTATFSATAYQLTAAASPAADGTIIPASGTFYAPGTVVNLTATANSGFSFTSWTGSVTSANSASTTITMNAPESVTANFSAAAGAAPVASLSSLSPLTFTATVGTTSAAQSATLTNSGNATLNITGITITGTNPTSFAVSTGTNACGATLAAGADCLIYVTFTPATAATFSATLSVADNAAGSPQTASLSGTGTPAPSFTLSSTTAPQSIQPGGTAQFTIVATAQNGTFSNAVSLSAGGLPTGAIATFSPASITPGSSSADSTLSIQTGTTNTAALTHHNSGHNSSWPYATSALALIGLCLVPGKRRRRWITMALLLIASLGALTGLTACGGGFAILAPPQSYTITVTGTSGTDVQTTTVQLTVQ